MPMNRREFVAASVAGAAMLNQGMKAFAAPSSSIQCRDRRVQGRRASQPDDFWRLRWSRATTGVWGRSALRTENSAAPVVPAPATSSSADRFPPPRRAFISSCRSRRHGRRKWTPSSRSSASIARASRSAAPNLAASRKQSCALPAVRHMKVDVYLRGDAGAKE